jgi:hypothetical protein
LSCRRSNRICHSCAFAGDMPPASPSKRWRRLGAARIALIRRWFARPS